MLHLLCYSLFIDQLGDQNLLKANECSMKKSIIHILAILLAVLFGVLLAVYHKLDLKVLTAMIFYILAVLFLIK